MLFLWLYIIKIVLLKVNVQVRYFIYVFKYVYLKMKILRNINVYLNEIRQSENSYNSDPSHGIVPVIMCHLSRG